MTSAERELLSLDERRRELERRVTQEKQQALCNNHDWVVKHEWKRVEGYYFAGDPEGTCGVDRRMPMNVPSENIDQGWWRTCSKCGLREKAKSVKIETKEVPCF